MKLKTKVKTHAKLNLCLLVFPPRKDGYHPLCSVFQEISLYDELTITPNTTKNLTLTCNNPNVPLDNTNILTKLFNKLNLPHGFNIHIEKTIPMGGGMGGGSTNAAGFLNYLNTHFLKWSETKLIKFATSIGADVPFFLKGGTCLVRGIGEKLTPLPTKKNLFFVTITPPIHCDTKQIFTAYKSHHKTAIKTPSKILKNHLGPNDLKPIVWNLYNDYKTIEKELHSHPIHMSGTGATIFIPTKKWSDALNLEKDLQKKWPHYAIHAVKPIRSHS